jgi:hypothetical protein
VWDVWVFGLIPLWDVQLPLSLLKKLRAHRHSQIDTGSQIGFACEPITPTIEDAATNVMAHWGRHRGMHDIN